MKQLIIILSCLIFGYICQTLNPYSHKDTFGSTRTMSEVKAILKNLNLKSQKGDSPHETNPITEENLKIQHKQVG